MGAAQPGDDIPSDSKSTQEAGELKLDQQENNHAQEDHAGQDLFTLRQPKESDLGFIFQTFIEGMYHGNEWLPQHISKENFWGFYRGILEGLFRTPGVGAWVLCLRDDPDTIIGYLVCSQGVAHWVYVKKSFRGYGLARRLFTHAGFKKDQAAVVSHLGDSTKGRLPKGWEFKPYLLF